MGLSAGRRRIGGLGAPFFGVVYVEVDLGRRKEERRRRYDRLEKRKRKGEKMSEKKSPRFADTDFKAPKVAGKLAVEVEGNSVCAHLE